MDGPLDSIAAYWNDAAPGFDREPDHGLRAAGTRGAWRRRLAGWLPGAGLDVLDAGCGTGSLSVLLAEAGHRVTGVDLAPAMVGLARAKFAAAGLAGSFLVGDASRPPTGDGRYDAVLCRHLLWTLPDPHAALREWAARLRPGGRLVLVEGRWREAGAAVEPYAPGAEGLPWAGGITASALTAALRPLVRELQVESLEADEELWGGPVRDERYAIVARV
ncbi:class I SAM-dependent methyltransferase [Kitasatospora sp. YST-16]|uniref:class I SAM-dependent methyltransferase n=1 Tax=unclassified Kitasatospora TaxID=2633591 RepID=UPI0004C31E48|nr:MULTISPECIES: class I SAM-dependent methyltransferase [unclassified Kitasatospora]WAL70365.1 class I SAM-dependent methyltransferase [Kitasatospora sp. YST-16]WNW36405.1 class I SAM-dependent methyltransferase [Streptomyces sp. Li-HN-5-13]